MKLHPRSSARCKAAIDSLSSCGPHPLPMAQAPKPISETFHPIRPNVRYFMAAILGRGQRRVDARRRARYHRRRVYIPLTDTLTRVLAAAQNEARRLNQDFVGTEHLAMALLDADDSEAGRVLAQMNVEAGYVRNALAHALPAGKEPPVVAGRLPMSPKAQRLVTHAIVSAQAGGKSKVSTRFLLAALVAEAAGVVCEAFRRSGADGTELVKALRERDVAAEP